MIMRTMIFVHLLFCLTMQGQIPNSSFETWIQQNGYRDPESWGTLNEATRSYSVFTCQRLGPGSKSNYFLYVNTVNAPGRGVIPGRVVSGRIDTNTFKPLSGYPFSGRPSEMTYDMQYMPYDPSDSCSVEVLFTKWNAIAGKRDTIARGASYYNAMAHVWFESKISLGYRNGEEPDSAMIVISSSSSRPKTGSYIYIDNLQFKGVVAGVRETGPVPDTIRIYPNPAAGTVFIGLEDVQAGRQAQVAIYDTAGNLLLQEELLTTFSRIDVSRLGKGICLLRIRYGNTVIHKKLLIQ
jgi:hypothetical protein